MRDYFREFILNKNPMSSFLGDEAVTEAKSAFAIAKPHIIWSIVTISVAVLTWKASKWYAGYEFMKQQALINTTPVK